MCLILAGIAKWLEGRMRRNVKVVKVAKSEIVAIEG